MIDDLGDMAFVSVYFESKRFAAECMPSAQHIINQYRTYRRDVEKKANFEPKRIIVFRGMPAKSSST